MYDTSENKEKIISRLEDCKKNCELSKYGWGEETIEILYDLSTRGKMVRGSLLMDATEIMGGEEDSIHYAAATELIHTGLLVHDDIIDRDEKRRGVDSVHVQFRSEEITDRQTENLAICAGDISYFTAYEIISQASNLDSEALSEFSSTFARVGVGEMSDIVLSGRLETVEDEVLEIHRNKTACYTFAMPLKIASILAEGPELEKLHEIGMKMGVLYQIRDDHLDIFSNEDDTGKPVASDIQEGKKTLHTEILREKTSAGEELYEEKTVEEAREVVRKMEESSVRKEVEKRIEARRAEVIELIEGLENPELRELLKDVLQLVIQREK
ncbi:polyprenyl synthetase family protein [Candidatus Nanohalovita haloferacivicina]|uniref:polyprenyl synthetase family protein n=1 Tax=Candidatus Nanohalovita haloferacivicina TaxID=2978046 RepID=UPI00325FD388|nr:Geranylgeranyl diphosphate synthase [Candidatus Nanohalobia archaeon BNXNv]